MTADNFNEEDYRWMKAALAQAERALENGEFPVGCVLVADGKAGRCVVGNGARKNSSGISVNELDHAEILALRDWLQSKSNADNLTCYVTLEPCFMCYGALMINGVSRIVFGYEDVMGGACAVDLKKPVTAGHSLMKPDDVQRHLYLRYGQSDTAVAGGLMRDRSLRLFYRFFSEMNDGGYLQGTYLEQYTLEQGRGL